MTRYKIIDVVTNNGTDYLRLKNIKKAMSPSILVTPDECLLMPYKDKYVFVLKKDLSIHNKIKELVFDLFAGIIVGGIVLFILFSWLSSEPEGYYRYKDGNADGTGIYYEWYEEGDK